MVAETVPVISKLDDEASVAKSVSSKKSVCSMKSTTTPFKSMEELSIAVEESRKESLRSADNCGTSVKSSKSKKSTASSVRVVSTVLSKLEERADEVIPGNENTVEHADEVLP